MNARVISRCLASLMYLLVATASRPSLGSIQESASPHFKFKRGPSGRTMKKGGIEISFSSFAAEDGTLVERFVEDYKTSEAALAGLEEESRRSSKISEDGYKTNARGRRVGRRVLVVVGRSASTPEHTAVARVDGSLLYLLRSPSRAHVLDFEQQVYPTPPTE